MKQAMVGRSLALAVACASLLAIGACSPDDGGLAGGCESPAPTEDLGALPEGISLDDVGTVVRLRERNGFVGARALAEGQVDTLYTPLLELLQDGGYEIVGEDNEGFEAEIFFTKDAGTGSLLLRQADCADEIAIILTFGG